MRVLSAGQGKIGWVPSGCEKLRVPSPGILDQQLGTTYRARRYRTSLRRRCYSRNADVKDGMQETAYRLYVTSQDALFRGVAAEQLVRRSQPVLTIWESIADLRPQCLSLIVQEVPGSHLCLRILHLLKENMVRPRGFKPLSTAS